MTTRKPKASGPPSEEDRALWRHVTRDARPLPDRQKPAEPDLPGSPEPEPPAKRPKPPRAPAAKPLTPPRQAPPLQAGSVVGVDKRTVDRLRRGKLPVEAQLDLHGMTQDEACTALGGFLARAQAAEKRCVLVITGKGTGRDRDGLEAPGALKRMTPVWLNEPANRARVLAFVEARPQHGGAGALYILLKRSRGD